MSLNGSHAFTHACLFVLSMTFYVNRFLGEADARLMERPADLRTTSHLRPGGEDEPLFQYQARPDPAFHWTDLGATHQLRGTAPCKWTGHLLNMTSQTWLEPHDFVGPGHVWFHQLLIIVPDDVPPLDMSLSTLFISGGLYNSRAPTTEDRDVVIVSSMACDTGTIGALVLNIPFQEIQFSNDPKREHRQEDSLVAYTWKYFLDHSEEKGASDWIIYMPMVKSAIRAMDAVQEWTAANVEHSKVSRFLVLGRSKRGWTTWLTGALDSRVVAMMPIVMDLLSVSRNLQHMWSAYGGFAYALKDYCANNVTHFIGTDTFAKLTSIIDPLHYLKWLEEPVKLVVDATGDQFFLPDDDWLWWNELGGNKYRMFVPNTDHGSCTNSPMFLDGATAFLETVAHHGSGPNFGWIVDPGTVNFLLMFTQPDSKPVSVRQWQATTDTINNVDGHRRDFRLVTGNTPADPCRGEPDGPNQCHNPVKWTGFEVEPVQVGMDGSRTYVGAAAEPATGWVGYFFEVSFPSPSGKHLHRLTTQVMILPNTFPFKACDGASCEPCRMV